MTRIPRGHRGYRSPLRSKPYKQDHEMQSRYRKIGGVPAHRLIVEERTGIRLPAKAVIHHCDPNDRLSNRGPFIVCEDNAYHQLLERRTRALQECGNPNYLKCRFCGKWDDPANMLKKESRQRGKPTYDRYDHYQFKYRCCANKAEYDAVKHKAYLAVARTEGIWLAIAEDHVRCILCGAEMICATQPKASHGKMHVREGRAVARVEPAIHPKMIAKGQSRTVYHPVDKQIVTTQLSEQVATTQEKE